MEYLKNIWDKIKSAKVLVPILMIIVLLLSTTTYVGYHINRENQEKIAEGNRREFELKAREHAAYLVADSINKVSEARAKKIDSLSVMNDLLKKDVSISRQSVVSLTQKVKQAKIDKDTTAYYHYADSLTAKTEELSDKIVKDSTNNAIQVQAFKDQLVAKDSVIAKNNRLYTQLRNDYEFNRQFNSQLVDENGQLRKQVKKAERGKKVNNIIKVAAAGVIGGLLLTK
jgi:hypothetical protein